MKTLLWLDDYRDPNDKSIDWMVFSPIGRNVNIVWVKSYGEFIDYLNKNKLPDGICFDHDLGVPNHNKRVAEGMSKRQSRKLKPLEKTGYDAAKWLVEYCLDNELTLPKWNCQSANPVGRDNINGLLNNFKRTIN